MTARDATTTAPSTAAKPHLAKVLGLAGAVGFGLAYMMPMASFTTYGVVNTLARGGIVTAYIVTLVAMLFTASSYAAMARAFPAAGAAYTYTRRTLGVHAGFLGGWTILLDYVLLPMMAYLVIGVYMHAAVPAVPQWAWIAATIVVVTLLNVLGVRLLSRVGSAIVAAQVVFVAVFLVLALVTASGQQLPSLPEAVFGAENEPGRIFAGATILCYSFLGFDAVSSISEETRDARRTVPRAILLVTLLGGLLFIVVSAVSNLAFPDWRAYTTPDAAANDVVVAVGGQWLGAFFTAAFVAGCFGAVLAQQAAAARVLYSMGRDRLLPARVFGFVHPRWKTPVLAVLVISAVGLISLFVDMTFASSLINFGALTAFSLVNPAVIKHYLLDGRRRGLRAILRYLVLPAIGFALCVWLWTSLSAEAFIVGLVWLAIGVVSLVALTRGFRVAPPELRIEEE